MKNKQSTAYVHRDPNEILRSLFALKDVRILGVQRREEIVEIVIERIIESPTCPTCCRFAQLKDRPTARYVDLPCFGEPARIVWNKHRFRCINPDCVTKSWVFEDHRIAAKSSMLTTRCAKWVTKQVGRGRPVSAVAEELHCGWNAVNAAVTVYGEALLRADKKRLNKTTALGLDETSFVKIAGHAQRQFCTTVADVDNHQIIDILPTRDFTKVAKWLKNQPKSWRSRIRYGALDMSNAYAAVFSVVFPKAMQVVDRFHAIALGNRALDEVRRRVQIEQLRHRGRKDDPLYRIRRSLLKGEERLKPETVQRLQALLELGDPDGEVAMAYRVKEYLRDFYTFDNAEDAISALNNLVERCTRKEMSLEIQRLGRTLKRWFDKIANWHHAKISNGPTEALNNLIKRIKRIGFGFTNFRNYRVRVLLYAGKPNWRVLDSIVVT